MSRMKRGRAPPAIQNYPGMSSSVWKSMETLLCKELGSCEYEVALYASLPASTQAHMLEKWRLYRPKVDQLRRELEVAYKQKHRTERIPEDIAALSENKAAAPLHVGAGVATEVLKQLPFAARLLVWWHAKQSVMIPELVNLLTDRNDLEHAEDILRARCESTRRRISHTLNGKYRVVFQIEVQKSSHLVKLCDVRPLPVLTFADTCLEPGRLVKVKLSKPNVAKGGNGARARGRGVNNHDGYIKLAHRGFKFVGEHFEAFGSKDPHAMSWYFVRTKGDADIPHATALRDIIGDWQSLPSVSTLACRLELALGGVALGPKLQHTQIELLEDVIAECEKEEVTSRSSKVMTDGSGFISPDLAEMIDARITQGQASPNSTEKPAAFQIRLICAFGCFKGTLMVKQGLRNKLQLRQSMLKIAPAPSTSQNTDLLDSVPGFNRLLIVNTSREANGDAELNKHLMLMLTQCTCDQEHQLQLRQYFLELLQAKIQCLAAVTLDRAAAYDYCSSAYQFNTNTNNANSLSTVLEMLLAGHELQEPYLTSLLCKHLRQDWDRLQNLRIGCPNSCYLMGIPDPTGSLSPGEVFIRAQRNGAALQGPVVVARFPLVHPSALAVLQAVESEVIETSLQGRAGVIVFSTQGEYRPVANMGGDYDGDLYYVNWNAAVTACYETKPSADNPSNATQQTPESLPLGIDVHHGTSNDKVARSTNTQDADSDDGSAEQVIPLVQPVIDVAATAASQDQDIPLSATYLTQLLTVPVRQIPLDKITSVLMEEWLQFLRNDMMGVSATQWLIYADRYGVHHVHTLSWAKLHEQALRARKHATPVSRHALPHSETYPEFMKKPAPVSHPSGSILGITHEMVQQQLPHLELTFNDFKLDEDMFHPKARNYIHTLNAWISDYAHLVSTIMAETSTEPERQTRIETIMQRYERMYSELVRAESRKHNVSTHDVENAIASALYEVCSLRFNEMLQRSNTNNVAAATAKPIVTYFNPHKKPPVHYLRFCWRLCGPILNRLKIEARQSHLTSIVTGMQNLQLSPNVPSSESDKDESNSGSNSTSSSSSSNKTDSHGSLDQLRSERISVSREELFVLIHALQRRGN